MQGILSRLRKAESAVRNETAVNYFVLDDGKKVFVSDPMEWLILNGRKLPDGREIVDLEIQGIEGADPFTVSIFETLIAAARGELDMALKELSEAAEQRKQVLEERYMQHGKL